MYRYKCRECGRYFEFKSPFLLAVEYACPHCQDSQLVLMETKYVCSYCNKEDWFSPNAEKMSAGARCCSCFRGFFGKPN
jgi:DNA-directed RNA polymerase subunit RPC12/RpoP